MDPVNYNIDVKTPFESALGGLQAGVGIGQMALKQQQQQLALQRQMQMQKDVSALAANQSPTGSDYAALMTKYPEISEHLQKSWGVLNAQQQQSKLSQAAQVHAALLANRPDVASQLLADQATALRNSGDQEGAKASDTLAKFIQMDPQSAKLTSGLLLSSMMGPDKFSATFGALGAEQRAADKAPAELRTANANATKTEADAAAAPQKNAVDIQDKVSQIAERGARLGLDQDKLISEMKLKVAEMNQKAGLLTDDARKIVNDSSTASVVADQSAAQMMNLADRLEPQKGLLGMGKAGYGGFSTAAEWLASATGNQDALTAMRQEYTRLRNSHALKMLPPGPASDKDIAFAMKGFPPDSADAVQMATFLRGMAKLQQRDAAVEGAKAEWVNAVGHLGKPKADIEIDGIKVPAGTTFVDFSRKFLDRRVQQRAAEQQAEQRAQQLQSRSYMRFVQPAQPGIGTGFYQPPGAQ